MNHNLRKSISLAALILATAHAFCQITITSTDMPSAGDTVRYSVAQNLSGFDFKTTAANNNWDFRALESSSQGVYEYKNSTSTPYVLSFGFAALGMKIADSLGSGQMSFKNVYAFYKKSTSKWESVGIGFQLGALPLPQAGKHTNTDEIYQFPLNYNDKDSATFALKIPLTAIVLPIGSYFQNGNRVNRVDGWGKISTPYQSNIECIRLKSVITETDSLAVAITGQDPINFAFPNNRVEYKWLSKTEKIPVLEVSGTELGGTFTPTSVRFRDKYIADTGSIGIKTVHKSQLKTYPNPANQNFIIELPLMQSKKINVFVFDMDGKNCDQIDLHHLNHAIEINTSRLASGRYTVLTLIDSIIYCNSLTIFH